MRLKRVKNWRLEFLHLRRATFLRLCLNYRRKLRIGLFVNWAKQALTLLVLANWFACIVHCQAEQMFATESGTASHRVTCHPAAQGANDGECHGICDWVVTGGYKASEQRVESPDLLSTQVSALLEDLDIQARSDQNQAALAEWSTPPPEHTNSFIYFCRTALPPRAPSRPV
jgi:hypothetical protein